MPMKDDCPPKSTWTTRRWLYIRYTFPFIKRLEDHANVPRCLWKHNYNTGRCDNSEWRATFTSDCIINPVLNSSKVSNIVGWFILLKYSRVSAPIFQDIGQLFVWSKEGQHQCFVTCRTHVHEWSITTSRLSQHRDFAGRKYAVAWYEDMRLKGIRRSARRSHCKTKNLFVDDDTPTRSQMQKDTWYNLGYITSSRVCRYRPACRHARQTDKHLKGIRC